MQITPESKLPDVGTTIFTVMSQLATETGAINLAQGFPSFEPPAPLIERINYHLANGANQYAPMAGVPALREAIADKTERLQSRRPDTETEITVCTGATEGLFSAIQALVHRGDEVIVLDPAYDAYEPAVALAGGTTRHVPLIVADNGFDFGIDWQRLADTLSDKTRLLIVNFPHNPTGAILDHGDLDQLAELLRGSNTLLLADEVYEHIVFDEQPHLSIASHPELWERCLVVSSFGKTFHATGWKIGYCIGPAAITAEFRKIHQFTTFSVSTPMQCAIADYLQSNADFYLGLSEFYEEKRDFFCEKLNTSRLRFQPARSTFFQIVDYGEISEQPDTELATRWTRDIGVASIPLSPFCEQDTTGSRLRLCFAKEDATLAEAADRLASL